MEEHMKNFLKRFFALALMAVLLVSMVACANTSETTSTPSESGTASGGDTSTAPDPNKEYLDENGQYVPKVGVLDEYKGETFDILVVGVSGGTYQSDDFTTESGGNGGIDYGDTFYKEGVGARNDKIEEMYGVNLEVWKEDDAFSKAKNDATSGTGTYDAVILSVGQLASLAQDNLLWDYNSSEFEGYIDTKAPWWAQSASEAYSIGGEGILYLLQDMRELELYGTVGAVVCCLDSLNYLLCEKDLLRVFSLVHNYLDPDGIFLFDMKTPYKFREVYGNNAYILEDEVDAGGGDPLAVFCGWQNEYHEDTGLCDFYLSVFRENEDGGYDRSDEHQQEMCYAWETVEKLLRQSGFALLGVWKDFEGGTPTETTERWYVAARAVKD
jgi:hypothetical protein